MMKFQKTLLVAMIAAVGASALLLVRGCDSKSRTMELTPDALKKRERTTAISHVRAKQEGLQALLDSYKHSIALYGKVVDQFGEAVPDATVEIFVHSEYFGDKSGTDAVLKTDKEGKFSINGLTGGAIGASAMKEGYLRIPPLSSISSSASLSYTGGGGTGDKHSVPANPIVLVLLKIGPTEPMVHVDKKRWKLPLDGTPQIIALNSKEGQGTHKIEFRFSSNWNKLPMDNEINSKLFDWSFEIRIQGGGLIWDESDAKFEAPASGYKEVVRYEYPATMPRDEWKRVQRGRYFVRFPDNTFGRIQFDIDGGSDRRPLYMESWLNLTPGSRNLATKNMIINVMESVESGR
jgi:hypothetical protein